MASWITYPDLDSNGNKIDGVIRCICNRRITLSGYDTDCDCGRLYNAFGQELAPSNQWSEQEDY